HEMFARNMATFQRFQPVLAGRIESVKTPHSQLITDGAGGYDIEFRGTRLYGKAGHEWAEELIDGIKSRPGVKRMILSAPDSRSLDDDANIAVHRIIKRSVEAGMSFSTQPTDDSCFHTVVFGVGLADHVTAFMELTDCQHLALIEPNAEFLYWSLFVFDWAKLYGDFVTRHRKISFTVEQTPAKIVEITRDRMRYVNPSFFDSTYFFIAYRNSVTEAALDLMLQQRDLFMTGLGFLEDELDMVRNSYHNLKDFEGHRYKKPAAADVRAVPVFVIGAGPSLDNDLDFIRANQDRVVIISCGTAIRVLLANGIKPDFQMEIENVPAVPELTMIVAEKFDMSGITLIATSTVYPGLREFYDRTIYYFRQGLSSFSLFHQGTDSSIASSTPNIANLGFAFAQDCGFRNIYLFGVDLGARDPKKHHARDSAYNAGEVNFDTVIDRPAPANFGGYVYSETIYLWAKAMLEEALHRYTANRTYYNCSDGVRITGTVPRLSSSIELANAGNKQTEVDAILSNFVPYTHDDFQKSWHGWDPVRRVKRFRDLLLTRCGVPRINPRLTNGGVDDGYDIKPARDTDMNERQAAELDKEEKSWETNFPFTYLCEITRDFIPSSGTATAEMHYYRGSTFMTMASIYFYYQRVLNAGENKEKYLEIVREEFADQTIRIANVILDFYDTLEPKKRKTQSKKAAPTAKTATAKTTRKSSGKKSQNPRKSTA
ncbi:MAG: 6-hydroxymethylpterin diphosphokinase MptE-like protein, partial [Rhodospirillaceae bacterium]